MHTHRTPFWGLVQDAESGPKSPGSHDCGLSLPCATEMYGAMARPCLKSCSAFPWLLEEYPNSSLCLTETCTGVAPVPLSGLFRNHLAHARGPATLAILLLPEHALTPTLLRLLLVSRTCFPHLIPPQASAVMFPPRRCLLLRSPLYRSCPLSLFLTFFTFFCSLIYCSLSHCNIHVLRTETLSVLFFSDGNNA